MRKSPPSGKRAEKGRNTAGRQPLALVYDDGGRLSLAAVNAAAEAGGLMPGLPLAEARALLPAAGRA